MFLYDLGVSIVMGIYHDIPNSWMVFLRENPNLKWMMTGATLIEMDPPIYFNMISRFLQDFDHLGWEELSHWKCVATPEPDPSEESAAAMGDSP